MEDKKVKTTNSTSKNKNATNRNKSHYNKNNQNNKNARPVRNNTNASNKSVKDTNKKVEVIEVKKETEKKKSVPRIIFDIVFWVCISVLAVIWITDFVRIQKDKEPIFCLSEKTHEFTDGEVNECVGLGYKIFDYKRESITAHQFGPFFTKMKK